MTGRCHRRSAAERELEVLDVNIYRHHCQSPQQYYHQLRQQGRCSDPPGSTASAARCRGLGSVSVRGFCYLGTRRYRPDGDFSFESALRGWCGEAGASRRRAGHACMSRLPVVEALWRRLPAAECAK